MSNALIHQRNLTSVSARKPSPAIWGDCPWNDIGDPRSGVDGCKYFWDFNGFKPTTDIAAAEAYWSMGLMAFGSTGAPVTVNDALGGGVTVGSDGDNEGVGIRMCNAPFQISRAHKKLWFEIRLQTSTIADTKHGFIAGLIENVALTATVPIAAAGTLADKNFVGLHRLEGDGDQIDTVYKADGVTQVTVQADALTTALAAATDIDLGFKWDPDDNYKLKFYANNLLLSTTYTMAAAAGTDFPNDVRLCPFFAMLNATGSTPGTVTLKTMRVAQIF